MAVAAAKGVRAVSSAKLDIDLETESFQAAFVDIRQQMQAVDLCKQVPVDQGSAGPLKQSQ